MPRHILFLFTDQQRRDTVHLLGNDTIQTPALDALAACSSIFDTAMTPSPVCVPARLSMLAGQYPARTGCTNNNKKKVYDGEGVYAALTATGYNSCCVGKMHNATDLYGKIGFRVRHTQEEMTNPDDDYSKFIMENYPDVFDYNGQRSEMYYVPQASPLPPRDHPTAWVGDRSVEFLDGIEDTSKPVFLMSSFIHPHPPFCPPAPWNKLYRDDGALPHMPENPDDLAPLCHKRFGTENMGLSERDLIRLKNYYYACVSFVDYQISRIIDKLKEKGMYEDTMIVFATDHGELLGDFGFMGKRSMLDSAVHIPFMIHLPGQTEQIHREEPVSLVDIAPTLLGYAGIEYNKAEFDGTDLFGNTNHEYVFSQYASGENGAYMITDGKYKLVYNADTDRHYFFDTFPEDKDKLPEYIDTPKYRDMKNRLDTYRASEAVPSGLKKSISGEKSSGGKGKDNPHYPTRMDHKARKDEEAAKIPAGYKIDL